MTGYLVRACPEWATSTAILAVRLVVGAAFVLHGWPKVQNPTGWMSGMDNAPPGFLQAVAAWVEVGGGLMLAVGFLTRPAAVLLACQMVAALALVHIPHHDPFVAQPGQPSAELACAYLAVSLLASAVGPGLFSADAVIFGRAAGTAPRSAAGLAPA